MTDIALTYIGGPTALLEYGGVRFLTDPTFDAPQTYEPRNGVTHTKTHGPALTPNELGVVDLALVSHHHHGDNLDILGTALLRDLSASGLVLRDVQTRQDSLEDIFVDLVRKEPA